jgi:hypothetical protein
MVARKDLDGFSIADVQNRLDRGDWVDHGDLRVVHTWLRRARREQAFIARCERANMSSALYVKRLAVIGNLIAFLALLVAIVALWK